MRPAEPFLFNMRPAETIFFSMRPVYSFEFETPALSDILDSLLRVFDILNVAFQDVHGLPGLLPEELILGHLVHRIRILHGPEDNLRWGVNVGRTVA